MDKKAIEIENVGKQYRLGVVGTGTLSDDFKRWIYKIRGKEDPFLLLGEENDRTTQGASDYVWALKNVNFSVKQGEVLGIIGRNGAGKSTLLKLLSRVTGPSVGEIRVKGRMASLLEVGTGFHPELTGRENIYLNGAILGMSKKEISEKIDEIIDFSGIRKYIDTPVKRYSSGMKVRLAFAVAAHLDPEILIVDEVLAVGDVEFQKKAVGKLKDVSGDSGRTVLFVSHNMTAIEKLCTRLILVDKGSVIYDGEVKEGILKYLQLNSNEGLENLETNIDEREGSGELRFTDIKLSNNQDLKGDCFGSGECMKIELNYNIESIEIDNVRLVVDFIGSKTSQLFRLISEDTIGLLQLTKKGKIKIEIPKLPLKPGEYSISILAKRDGELLDEVGFAKKFIIEGGNFFNSGKMDKYNADMLVMHNWKIENEI